MSPETRHGQHRVHRGLLALSLDQYFAPGTAPSRLNAKSMREAEVRQAVVQKSWPIVAISSTRPDIFGVQRLVEDDLDTSTTSSDTPSASWTAKRNDSSRIQPPIAE